MREVTASTASTDLNILHVYTDVLLITINISVYVVKLQQLRQHVISINQQNCAVADTINQTNPE
jgi:hypothetical protein